MREFGAAFGTAYQVYDDCVDLFGGGAAAGKSLGTDLAKGKLTWPVLLAWERARRRRPGAAGKTDRALAAGNLAGVNELLARYGTFEPSLAVIGTYLDRRGGR